jgi:hypothetical protein
MTACYLLLFLQLQTGLHPQLAQQNVIVTDSALQAKATYAIHGEWGGETALALSISWGVLC